MADNQNMKIGIVGAGISGLGAAYLLAPEHDVTVFERNDYAGGHSRTIDVPAGRGRVPVDTGFIVFNNWNYPNLLGLFGKLGVPYQKSDMSFGVCIEDGWLEYSSYGLFAQRRNIWRPAYWRMLADIVRFNKQAPAFIEKDADITLRECLDRLRMGRWFRNYYILAMGASIWSCPIETIMEFPARTFLQFFKNHGLLNIRKRPQWYTVTGGSREYVARLTAALDGRVRVGCAAVRVTGGDGKAVVTDAQGVTREFDRVIFACHADEALAMIEAPRTVHRDVLGAFGYQTNRIVVHSDSSFMPRNRKCWASWVYLSEKRRDEKPAVALSYWMNNLQGLDARYPMIVTLNPEREPQAELVYDRHEFAHPVFDRAAVKAQVRMGEIQGIDSLWFCGAYQRYGFHEDGLLSAVNVARAMGAAIPWEA
ncbi:MAG: FAD-dependent oxidoreductase [Alphaproteobacteria bacterium]|nr:FAD-dependent oxidoreductase [Alphaproteobacteria bacterium]